MALRLSPVNGQVEPARGRRMNSGGLLGEVGMPVASPNPAFSDMFVFIVMNILTRLLPH